MPDEPNMIESDRGGRSVKHCSEIKHFSNDPTNPSVLLSTPFFHFPALYRSLSICLVGYEREFYYDFARLRSVGGFSAK